MYLYASNCSFMPGIPIIAPLVIMLNGRIPLLDCVCCFGITSIRAAFSTVGPIEPTAAPCVRAVAAFEGTCSAPPPIASAIHLFFISCASFSFFILTRNMSNWAFSMSSFCCCCRAP